jgi:hypothetical protein
MGYDEHGPAYPEPQCRICRSRGVDQWCIRDNCPGRNPLPEHDPANVSEFHRRIRAAEARDAQYKDRYWHVPTTPYQCPICDGDQNRFMMCDYPGCPDGCDQPGRFQLFDLEPPTRGGCFIASLLCAALVVFSLIWGISHAFAFDHGFDPYDPATKWFGQLLRHDKMPEPCCGKADAYVADTYTRNKDGSYDVTITDGAAVTFPDGTERPEIENGSVIHVPWNKINPPSETMGNPTGHAWVFVSVARDYTGGLPNGVPLPKPGYAYCFAPLPEGS